MVKLRMTTVDVAAEVRCLRKLIGFRCANIYDVTPKTYVFKFSKSSGVAESGESEKALVLLESGVRSHTTEFARDKSSTPSGFTLKLRKFLRTQRLEDVCQLGIDRVVDFQFGRGDNAHHVMLELYAQGNLILTDHHYNILQLLRTWKDEEKGLSMTIHQQYPVDNCRLLQKTTEEKLLDILKAENLLESKPATGSRIQDGKREDGKKPKAKWGKEGEGKGSKGAAQDSVGGGNKEATLKWVLGEGLGYGPVLIEHIILDAALVPNMKIAGGDGTSPTISDDDFRALKAAVTRFENWVESVVGGDLTPEGYIFMQKSIPGTKQTEVKSDSEKVQVYDEFYPLVLKQLEGRDHVKFETFDAALDEFFSKVEGQRADQQRKAQEDSALSKLEKIRADQTNRVKALEKEVDQSVRMAELIEYNLDDVDAALNAVRTALATGMDWMDLGRMIKEEKKAGNPVAGLIHSLQLQTNQVTLLLSNNLDDMDDDEKTRPVDKVMVDFTLSAHANARYWFETKKKRATKQEKTLAAHEKAFKAAEKKTQQQLAQAKTVAAITHMRKVHWFEKFNWFISSENFLVISGRDAQQNEVVVKRYMKKGDLYVHADLHGASSTVIKNHDPSRPIPPLTTNQAGCFTVCRSQAWDSKIVTSAWWVEAHQVSKKAPTGEYLTVGSFMVRGKKNFLPPNPLVMGFGFLFRLDDSCLAAHLNERQIRGEEDDEGVDPKVDGKCAQKGKSDNSMVEDEGSESDSLDPEMSDVLSSRTPISEENTEEGPTQLQRQLSASQDDDRVVETTDMSDDLDGLFDKALQVRSAPVAVKGASKYALEDLKIADDEDSHHEIFYRLNVSKGAQREKPYVSKAERRQLKKGGGKQKQTDDFEEELDQGNELQEIQEGANAEPEDEEAHGTSHKEKGGEPAGTKPGRGRKGKLKKIKGKYADQDEEERQLRMAILASAGRKDSKENEKDTKGTSGEPTKEGSRDLEMGSKVCYKCKRAGHIASDCPGVKGDDVKEIKDERNISAKESGTLVASDGQQLSIDNSSLAQVNQNQPATNKTRDGLSWRAYAKAGKEEIAAIITEEDVFELGDDDKEKLTELDSLTGKPLASDVLLYAVPVCGPYSALQGCKYHVKLTPGTAKRGKAAKLAVDVFSRSQEVTAREKELMKAVTDPELVASMIGDAKVTAPGLTKLKPTKKSKG